MLASIAVLTVAFVSATALAADPNPDPNPNPNAGNQPRFLAPAHPNVRIRRLGRGAVRGAQVAEHYVNNEEPPTTEQRQYAQRALRRLQRNMQGDLDQLLNQGGRGQGRGQ